MIEDSSSGSDPGGTNTYGYNKGRTLLFEIS